MIGRAGALMRDFYVGVGQRANLAKRVVWYTKVRWLFILAISVPGLLSELIPLGIHDALLRDAQLAGLALLSNALFFWLSSRLQKDTTARVMALTLLFLDIATITALIFMKGGIESRSPILYVIPILMSSVVFGRKGLYYTAFTTVTCYNALIILDAMNVIHSIGAVNPQLRTDIPYVINSATFFAAALLVIGLLIDFIVSLVERASARAQEQTEALQKAQSVGHIGSWEWDISTNQVTWSQELFKIFGIKPQKSVSYESYLKLLHPEDRKMADAAIRQALGSKQPFSFDHRVILPDGNIRWIHGEGVVEQDKNGKPIKMSGTAQDITAEKRRENKLQGQTEELEKTKLAILNILEDLQGERDGLESLNAQNQALLESIGDGVVATNTSGKVIFVNDTALKMLGFDKADMEGKAWGKEMPRLELEDGTPVPYKKRPLAMSIQTGKKVVSPYDDTYFYVKKNGERFPVYIAATPVMRKGKVSGSIAIFRDISKEKEIEKAKDEFVSLASHQLRTPASGVKQALGLLDGGYLGEMTSEQKELIGKALESNEREIQLIEDLLRLATIDAGKLRLNLQEKSLNKIVKDIAEAQKVVVTKRGQILKLNLPKTTIKANVDVDMLGVVLDNLLSNASKYTPDGGKITVTLNTEAGNIYISVKDNGIGIPDDQQDKLFKKFSRIDSQLARNRGGSGIGLYLTKRIVELHGGRIKVISQVGKGSDFVIQLPKKKGKSNGTNTSR